jgi:peptidoglycan/xylan/chitin deacetylase (PgdA/CDA1 family)
MNILKLPAWWTLCLIIPGAQVSVGQNNNLKEVPVLCYHNVCSKVAAPGDLWIDAAGFESQICSLKDSGYVSILPDDLYRYSTMNEPLPPKPVIISFDDSHAEQATVAAPVLRRYGFKAVFFIMTVTIDKAGYLSVSQIRELSDEGNCIGSHSYDHPLVTGIEGTALKWQFYQSERTLERLTGKQVFYAAYPYGVWSPQAVDTLKSLGYKAAFQLNGQQNMLEPLFTLRRITASGKWSGVTLQSHMRRSFKSL